MNVRIYFENEQTERSVSEYLKRLIRKTVRATLDYEGFAHKCELSVTFTDNEGIHTLNREYRGIDRPTDVLSFPQFDFGDGETLPTRDESVSLGDVVLSLERAAEQAREYGHSYSREIAFLTAHSVLHLLGYDHEKGEKEDEDMRKRQRAVMDRIGLSVS